MVFDLQSNNITAISGGIEDFRPWVELVMSVGGWLVSTFDDGFYHCRCHKSVNACMGGRQISFRSSCYKGEQEVNCFDFVEYCNK